MSPLTTFTGTSSSIVAFVVTCLPALGQNFNIDVGTDCTPNDDFPMSEQFPGAANLRGYWNAISSDSFTVLTDVDDNVTTVTMFLSGGVFQAGRYCEAITNSLNPACNVDACSAVPLPPCTTSPIGRLGLQQLYGDFHEFDEDVTWIIDGLDPGTYDVWIYSVHPDYPGEPELQSTLISLNQVPPVYEGSGRCFPAGNVVPHRAGDTMIRTRVGPGVDQLRIDATPGTASTGVLSGIQIRRYDPFPPQDIVEFCESSPCPAPGVLRAQATLTASGAVDVTANDLLFTVESLPNNMAAGGGLLAAMGIDPCPMSSDLCLQSPGTIRLEPFLFSTPDGGAIVRAEYGLDAISPFDPGTTWYFQSLFRCGQNCLESTNGLQITFGL